MRLIPASRLTYQPFSWLWANRLAFGKLSILDGDPGLGKSLLALDLCARLSRSWPMPDGSPGPGICNSLFCNAEDVTRDTTLGRLHALGADLDRVHVLDPNDLEDPLSLPSHIGQLEEALNQTKARFVVLDPITLFLDPSVNDASNQSVRRALHPLAILADRFAAHIQLNRHLNKKLGGRAIYRGAGSIGFQAACGSGWLLARNPSAPTDPIQRVLAEVKNKDAPPQPSLALSIQTHAGGSVELSWLGQSALTVEEVLAARPACRTRTVRDGACQFLAAFLRDGPRTTRDIWAAGSAEGFSDRTLQRACEDLKVKSSTLWEGKKKSTYWRLPAQESPRPAAEDPEVAAFRARLDELEKEYPPSTPLDE
jgi:hypothetical protein